MTAPEQTEIIVSMKITLPSLFKTVALAALTAVLITIPSRAQQKPAGTITFTGATNQNLQSLDAVRKGFDTFGRKWSDGVLPAVPATEPAVQPPAPAAIVGDRAIAEIRYGLVHLVKSVPTQVGLGETYSYDLTATAIDDAGNIIITDTIPDGASYVKSEPPARVEGNLLGWTYPVMHRGDVNRIKVWLKADREGELTGCATIFAVPRRCVTTVVGKATLEITKTGPESALLGADVAYKVLVTNKGNTTAKDVVVTDVLPEGLTHTTGKKEIAVPMGDILPKQAKTFTITLKAVKRGRHANSVTATSSNAEKVSAEAATTVVQQGLKIVKTGDKEQFLNRRATYEVVVSNTGDTPLKGVVVTDTAPPETSLLAADGATIAGNTATWRIGTLNPGEEKKFAVSLIAKVAGKFNNTAAVVSDEGLRQTADAATLWRGVSALLLEKADDPDPIQIGETTTYTVRVTNQGSADDTNVAITVVFPKELTPTLAVGGQIQGQTVKFPPVPRLASKQVVTYTIKAKGVAEGDARVKFSLTADGLTTPVNAEESTRIF